MDSIKTNGEKYHTEGGRIVYGGGGVIPDHFVGIDTTDITSYYKDLYMSGLINKFAIEFVDNNRSKLTSFDDVESFKKYLDRQNVIDQLANYAEKNGIRRRNLMIQRSYHLLRRMSYQYIISNTFDNSRAIEYLNEMDPVVAKALLIIDAGETFPIKAEHAAQ